MGPPFTIGASPLPLVTAALHAGHEVRPAVAARMGIDDADRRREEDPYTDRVTRAGGAPVVAHRSRFEVDLNRSRDEAVYRSPADAWGLDVWRTPLPADEVHRSLAIHDAFYAALAAHLDILAVQGPFAVLDLHSYNHRRAGADAPADVEGNPEVNVGTGTLDRGLWAAVVDRFMDDLRRQEVAGHALDVRENVRFRGGHLTAWVHDRYPGVGCALAIELKKVFMDEWTGEVDDAHVRQLTGALRAALPGLLAELAAARAR